MRAYRERPLSAETEPTSHSPADVRAVTFFDAVHRAFEEAERFAGSVVRDYVIAGHPIRLRFAGPALLSSIVPALEHLAASTDQPPALTVCLCDSASTDIQLPLPPWEGVDYAPGGDRWRLVDQRFKVFYQPDVGILNMLDSEKDQAVYWVGDCDDLRFYERASPLRNLLYWWMRDHGRQFTHAAATGNSQGGVLIGGKGGSGKTTTSLACLDAGLLYAGDNYILLSQESGPTVHGVYNSCTLHAPHMHTRLPWLAAKASNPNRLEVEKALVFLYEHYPESVATSMPVKAVLLPEITGDSVTKLRRISPGQCLTLLAPSSIFNLPAAGEDDFRYLARFVRKVPSYVLELGTDLSAVPGVIVELLSSTRVSP